MKLIFKQIGLLLSALIALYGLLLVVCLLWVPRSDLGQRLNAGSAGSSLFLTEPKYVFMARSQLNSLDDKAILVGASNMLVGFKQAQVQALVPGMQVHNLSVGGSNITQINQIVDLVREVQTPDVRRHNTWVIGLWYGVFAEDRARWFTPDRHGGDTDIDIERYRYGFYRRTEAGPQAVLPPQYLDIGTTLIHPYLVLDRAARDLTGALRAFLSGRSPGLTDAQRNATVLSAEQQHKYFDFWRGYMGDTDTLTDPPFQVMEAMVNGILADGGRVVLVDMAIPQWHEQGSPLWADYRRRVDPLLAKLQAHAAVKVLKMDDATADADFSDEVHPKPRATPAWAQRLATVLNTPTP
ncbi:hypothetical protein [Rhodoferax sp. WC2427]|uniref:hypothetical protein n=1 Tax=Rhodoferax sp. WC2427 TaxID=3234144 RepID=UPI0034674345